jgi:ABC-type multidrug transport system fused ATPase/permease subunit
MEESSLLKWLNPDCTANLTDMVHIEGHPAIEPMQKSLTSCAKTKAMITIGVHIIIIIVLLALATGAVISWITSLIICGVVAVIAGLSYSMTLYGPWSNLTMYNNEVKELTRTFGSLYTKKDGSLRNTWEDWRGDIGEYERAKEKAMTRSIDKERNAAIRGDPNQKSSSTAETLAAIGLGSLLGSSFNKRGGEDDGEELSEFITEEGSKLLI